MAAAAVVMGPTVHAGETLSGSHWSLQFWVAKYYIQRKCTHLWSILSSVKCVVLLISFALYMLLTF